MINEQWKDNTIAKMAKEIESMAKDNNPDHGFEDFAEAAFNTMTSQLPNTAPNSTEDEIWMNEGTDSVKLVQQLIAMRENETKN